MYESEKGIDLNKFEQIVRSHDLVWFQSIMNQFFLWNLLNTRRFNPKIKIVMDVDDNLYTVNPWNPSYESFTTDEEINFGDMKHKLPRIRNHARIRMFETMMIESDAVVTTTEVLAARYTHLNKNIYVMPNSLIWENWNMPHIPWRNDGKIRIAWSGGSSHKMDWLECHAACRRITQKHANVLMEFQTSPMCYAEFLRDLGEDKIVLHDWIDYTGHAFRMNCFKPEIAVIPLHEDEFSVCKSDLKFTEYAALKVPCVCSNIPPYSRSVQHGVTGFLAKDDLEFEKYLDLLINDSELRAKMGQAAYDWAYQNRRLEGNVDAIKGILDEIMTLPSWHIMPDIQKKEVVGV
jgi:glycosyltransferase involved in cell wall biosynthesis